MLGVNLDSVKRIFWIVALLFALVVFGGWTIVIVYAGIRHRHLNGKGFLMLFSDGYVAWIIFNELCRRVSESPSNHARKPDSVSSL